MCRAGEKMWASIVIRQRMFEIGKQRYLGRIKNQKKFYFLQHAFTRDLALSKSSDSFLMDPLNSTYPSHLYI